MSVFHINIIRWWHDTDFSEKEKEVCGLCIIHRFLSLIAFWTQVLFELHPHSIDRWEGQLLWYVWSSLDGRSIHSSGCCLSSVPQNSFPGFASANQVCFVNTFANFFLLPSGISYPILHSNSVTTKLLLSQDFNKDLGIVEGSEHRGEANWMADLSIPKECGQSLSRRIH